MANMKNLYLKYKKYFPAIAFFSGFLWDIITLGLKITTLDLFIILAYMLGAVLCMILIGRNVHFKFSEYTNLVLQFFLGGIFSALVVFYFKSSENLAGYTVVLLMVVVLVLNEFLDEHYNRLTVSWALFTFCSIMFFNFSLPHLLGSVLGLWFYISTGLGILLTYYLRKLCTANQGSLTPSLVLTVIVVILYLVNWIPPVPLVKKNMEFCHHLEKTKGEYIAQLEKRPWYQILSFRTRTFHRKPNEKIFCFSSIFAPSGISTKIYHQWLYYHPELQKWQSRDRIGFNIHSGRKQGYRGYTHKQNLEDGLWRVRFELENGSVLGRKKIRIRQVEEDVTIELREKRLE
jgi:hypothetical protein